MNFAFKLFIVYEDDLKKFLPLKQVPNNLSGEKILQSSMMFHAKPIQKSINVIHLI